MNDLPEMIELLDISNAVLFEDKTIQRDEENGDVQLDLELLQLYHTELFEYFNKYPEEFISKVKSNLLGLFDLRKDKTAQVICLPKNIINIKLKNFPRLAYIPISHLRSENLNGIVLVKGILKLALQATSKIESILFECPSCGTFLKVAQIENNTCAPTKCACGRKGGFRQVEEEYINIQEMELEENIDEIGSRQPHKVRLLLKGSLTDPEFNRFQVGNKVEIIGILKKMPRYISGKEKEKIVIDYLIDVLEIKSIESTDEDYMITEEDEKKIVEISKNNPLKTLSENLAPSISGLEYIKEAIVLLLAKGVTKYLPNGERKRGEIHILIVSDPGLAKSTLAENVKKRVINCRIADGKGTSRAGLIFGMVQDPLSKKWGLEAGDIVLANKGILIIDEFDKVSEADRESIHGPLERGMVLVSKVGIHASLKAETGVLALANPKTGAFSLTSQVPIISQIDLPPSLLSRFDLIFSIKDVVNREADKNRAREILEVHRGNIKQDLDLDIIKKYILYCSKIKPVLDDVGAERISEIFSKLRQLSTSNGQQIGTAVNNRHLEGLNRLSEAHAKLRLSNKIEDVDIDKAEELFIISLNQFGYDKDMDTYDLSRITTKIRPTKKDKYYQSLTLIKKLFELNAELSHNTLIESLQNCFGVGYGEAIELIDLLHKEGEIYESAGKYKLSHKNS